MKGKNLGIILLAAILTNPSNLEARVDRNFEIPTDVINYGIGTKPFCEYYQTFDHFYDAAMRLSQYSDKYRFVSFTTDSRIMYETRERGFAILPKLEPFFEERPETGIGINFSGELFFVTPTENYNFTLRPINVDLVDNFCKDIASGTL